MRVGGGGWGWAGSCHFFNYFTVQSLWLCGGNVRFYFSNLQSFQLVMQDSHPSLYYTKAWYYLYISDNSGSLQKMLTALFNLVLETQKSK